MTTEITAEAEMIIQLSSNNPDIKKKDVQKLKTVLSLLGFFDLKKKNITFIIVIFNMYCV